MSKRIDVENLRTIVGEYATEDDQCYVQHKTEWESLFTDLKTKHSTLYSYLKWYGKEDGSRPFSFNRMLGGVYSLSYLIAFFQYLSRDYNRNPLADLQYLSENARESYHLFLDIESPRIDFTDRELCVVIKITYDYVSELISEDEKSVLQNVKIFIAHNNHHTKRKFHVIFNGLVVNKELHVLIIRYLKERLNSDLAVAIDPQAVTGLRILGAKKANQAWKETKASKSEQVQFFTEKGWYVPRSTYDVENNMIVGNVTNGLNVETFFNHSISNYRMLPVIQIRKSSLLYRCLLDKDRIIENPPNDVSFAVLKAMDEDVVKEVIESIPKDLYQTKVGDGKRSTYIWFSIGRICYMKGIDLDYWIELSKSDYYQNAAEECEKKWGMFQEGKSIDPKKVYSALLYFIKQYSPQYYEKYFVEDLDIKAQIEDEKRQRKSYYKTIANKVLDKKYDLYEGDVIKDSQYVQYENIKHNSKPITLIQAPMGSGKTTAIFKYIQELESKQPIVWLSVRKTFTNSLTQKATEHGFIPYNKIKGNIYQSRVLIQYESIKRLDLSLYKNCIVICDEVNSLITQTQSSTNGKHLEDNVKIFEDLCKNSKKMILADAFLNRDIIDIINVMGFTSNDYNIYIYKKTKPRKYQIINATKDENNKTVGAFTNMQNLIINKYKAGEKIYVFCSSRKHANYLYDVLTKDNDKTVKSSEACIYCVSSCVDKDCEKTTSRLCRHNQDVLLYTGQTNNNDLDNVNELWKDAKCIITTSCITIGIDCQIQFDDMFAFVSAFILNRDVIQSLYRVRNVKNVVYFAFRNQGRKDYSFIDNSFYNEILPEIGSNINIIKNNYKNITSLYASLETLEFRFFFLNKIERNLNTEIHEEMFIKLIQTQGYEEVKNDLDLSKQDDDNEVDFRGEFEPCFEKVKLINKTELDNLIKRAKQTALTPKEQQLITKYKVCKYTNVEKVDDDFWVYVCENESYLDRMKRTYEMYFNCMEAYIGLKRKNNIALQGKGLIYKNIFDKIIESKVSLNYDREITNKEVYQLYNCSETLNDVIKLTSKYDATTSRKNKIFRVNSMLETIFGLKISIPKQEHQRINGKRIDVSKMYVKQSERFPIIDYVKKQRNEYVEPTFTPVKFCTANCLPLNCNCDNSTGN